MSPTECRNRKIPNIADRRPFWKWRRWKSIGFYSYTPVLWYWSLELIFKAKLKLGSGNKKIQYGHQVAILKVTLLKINRLLPMAIINMHVKFEIEIRKQNWFTLRKQCRLQAGGRLDTWTDGRTRWFQYTPSNFVGRREWKLIPNSYDDFKIGFVCEHYTYSMISLWWNAFVFSSSADSWKSELKYSVRRDCIMLQYTLRWI